MPKIEYVSRKFTRNTLAIIEQANAIIAAYTVQGYDLTLRQLYYQFVSRDLIPNKQSEYDKLGSVINDARLAGLVDWDAIKDRTRDLHSLSSWDGPANIVNACAEQFRLDKWKDQCYRVEVWIEKDALSGVFERVCDELQISCFSCRGYTSQSSMWEAARRHRRFGKQKPIVLHFGDHDPSGIDMTRDIEDRLALFGASTLVRRLALNMNQVAEYDPPPNPAKSTDSRFSGYVDLYGDESWELDALEPAVLSDLVRTNVAEYRDEDLWNEAIEAEEESRKTLSLIADNWDQTQQFLQEITFEEDEEE